MGCCASVLLADPPVVTADQLSSYVGDGPWAFTNSDAKATILYAKEGSASEKVCPATTIPLLFLEAKTKKPDKFAMSVERGNNYSVPECKDGRWAEAIPRINTSSAATEVKEHTWNTWTWAEYYDTVWNAAKSLIALGFQPHDAANVYGFNSPEWFFAQAAAIFAGGKVAGIYPSDNAEQVQFKSFHSGGTVAFVEDQKKLKKFSVNADALPGLKAIVVWTASESLPEITRDGQDSIKVYTWKEFMALGEKVEDGEVQKRVDAQDPGHCCALIYTSGTTGKPKAVMISHDNLIFESNLVMSQTPIGSNSEQERIMTYLPLSHIAAMMLDFVFPIMCTARKIGWTTVYCARPYDLKAGSLGDRLRSVQPTVFLGVPRVWEKIADKIRALGKDTAGCKKKIAVWAKAKGLDHQKNSMVGGTGAMGCCYCLANKLVFSPVLAKLGLDECKFAVTGAAPISVDTLTYFGSLGLHINEMYGMSESTGVTTLSTDQTHQWGSCGFAPDGLEVKIFRCEDEKGNPIKKFEVERAKDFTHVPEKNQGEICFRGRHIMLGYLANPKLGEDHMELIKKKTSDAIDSEGWLHSGDKGCMNTYGMVKITGRYKEIIIGAGGENIAPVPIENNMKKLCLGISNVIMIGNKRKFNVCIITLKVKDTGGGELPGSDNLDGEALFVNPDVTTVSAAMEDDKWISYIENAIMETNKNGDVCPSNAAKIQKFSILPCDLSVLTGELTATLKIKRSVVEKHYAELIDSMYSKENVKNNYIKCPTTSEGTEEKKDGQGEVRIYVKDT